MGSNWLSHSSPQGEVDREAGRRGSAEPPLTPSPGFAGSSPLGEQLVLEFLHIRGVWGLTGACSRGSVL